MYHSKNQTFFAKWRPKSSVFEWFSLDRFIHEEKNVALCIKWSRLIYHLKTGHHSKTR